MATSKQSFGGNWTAEKLERLQKYLAAYVMAMKAQPFQLTYIDAFAGTGYNTKGQKKDAEDEEAYFPELAEPEVKSFVDGSARIALKISPAFHRFVFIEKAAERCRELEKLRDEFPSSAEQIKIVQDDANAALQSLCAKVNWSKQRAVLFLDPFGMQVSWDTIRAIAETKAIDVWILFPLGMAVNRLLTRSGKMAEGWRNRLNDFFGTDAWQREFYRQDSQMNLFGEEEVTVYKDTNLKAIGEFFNKRLGEIFPGVAKNPLSLLNSIGTPLFLLCFAVSNPSPKARALAIKIAQDILSR